MNNFNDFGNGSNNNDSDRTRAMTFQKKERKPDSISWIVTALILFFLTVMSLGRITIVGQFLDDIIFTFPFGWFKYFLYLLFFIVDFAIYFGIKFKPKKRFLAMIFVTWIMMCWIITSVLFIVAHLTKSTDLSITNYWSKDIFKDSITSYFKHWHAHSYFGTEDPHWLISSQDSYFTSWAGGGMFGAILAGVASYTTIYGSLILALFFFFINMMWIFTGDPFYLFKPKDKRRGKRLRILSLGSKPKMNLEPKNNKKRNIFNIIRFDSSKTLDDIDFVHSIRESDITIELPSFSKVNDNQVYQPADQNFYNDDYFVDYQEPTPMFNEFDFSYDKSKNYSIGNRGYSKVDQNLDQMQEINFDQPKEEEFIPQFLPREHKQEIFNEEIRKGQVSSSEEARRNFERQTKVTPHGIGGQTQELIKEFKRTPTEVEQITLEDFMNSSISEQETKDKQWEKTQNYVSPMEEIRNKRIVNSNGNIPIRNQVTKTIELNKQNSLQKVMFVNKNYVLPTIDILKKDTHGQQEYEKQKQKANLKADAINKTFAQFNVNAKVVNMNIGPSVTKFEIQPGQGTKVNSITSLENDLKLALANQNVRIEAPIQGKAAVGIEVPNEEPLIVPLRSVINNIPLQKMSSKLLFAIGKTVMGELLFGELDKAPHLLVAGSTGSGKSVMINGIITSILMRAKPHEVKFLMIDPKQVELSIYASIPHLLAPVISDMNLANNALKKVINEMERRYILFTNNGVKNIEGYNSKIADETKRLPFYVIVIDELADLMMTANKKEVEDSIMRLTQMARAAGIHLIVATQRPSTDVLTGVIKSNIPTRIGFSVASGIDSRTILDSIGAEKLIGRGDLLYLPPGSSNLLRAQGAYVSDEEIERIVQHCSSQQQQIFEEEFMRIEEDNSNRTTSGFGKDEKYEEIRAYVIQHQKASTSWIQRVFSIGYNRAAKIIEDLEQEGVIGPQTGSKPREVYWKNEEIY